MYIINFLLDTYMHARQVSAHAQSVVCMTTADRRQHELLPVPKYSSCTSDGMERSKCSGAR